MVDSATIGAGRAGRASGNAAARFLIPLVEILLLGLLAFILARLIWLIAFGASAGDFQLETQRTAGQDGGARYEADLNLLRETRLFADRRVVEDVAEAVELAPETQLNLVLRGVRRGEDALSGAAIIQTPDNRQQFFAVDAEIMDGVTLEEVHLDHVIIRRRGIAESLYLREESERRAAAARNASASPAESAATAGAAPDALAGLDLTDVFQVRPAVENGRLIGYRLTGSNAPVIEALGFRAGDVVTEINGNSLADSSDLAGLLEAVEEEETLFVAVLRNGMSLTIQMDLP